MAIRSILLILFFGSGAVLLGRPGYDPHCHTETVNDLNGYLCNFWRAIQADPEAVAAYADYPVSELDLHARHTWLMRQSEAIEQLRSDPDYFDVKIAGWWVWGQCAWIGAGWCDAPDNAMPNLKDGGVGLHRKCPAVANAGRGVHRKNGQAGSCKLPAIADGGKGVHRKTAFIYSYFEDLSARMRRVRVCCGDWSRVVTPAVTWGHGVTAVILDPPYDLSLREKKIYAHDQEGVAAAVREWALANGSNPLLRIALCGYQDEFNSDEFESQGWTQYRWTANGGYGLRAHGRGRENREKEVIWFSPHCLPISRSKQLDLFSIAGAGQA